MPDPQYIDENENVKDGYQLCIDNNRNAEFLDLDIGKNFESWYTPFITTFSTNTDNFNCNHEPLTPTVLTNIP